MSEHEQSFPPPRPDARVVPGTGWGAQTPPGPAPATSTPGQRNRWPWIVGALLVVVVLVGAVGVPVLRRGGSNAAPGGDGIPTKQPKLTHSVTIDAVGRPYYSYGARIGGTPDDFYIAESGDESTQVTHFVDGEAAWTADVGLPSTGTLEVIDGQAMVNTYMPALDGESVLVALNPDDGSTAWSITSPITAFPREHEGRYYLLKDAGYSTDPAEVIEFDPATGAELKRYTGIHLRQVTDGYAAYDDSSSEFSNVQFIDFELEPVGDPVRLESGGELGFAYFDRGVAGWLSFVAPLSSSDNEPAVVIGRSPAGDPQFECDATVPDAGDIFWNQVFWIDETTVGVSGTDGIEVFSVDGSDCTSLWSLAPSERNLINQQDSRLEVRTFPTVGNDEVDRFGVGTRIDFVDWRTGEPTVTGVDDLFVDDQGRMVTHEGGAIVARQIDSDEELWRIDADESSELAVVGSMVVVITESGDTATVDIYSG